MRDFTPKSLKEKRKDYSRGVRGNQRGLRNENRVFSALVSSGSALPEWVCFVRKCTSEEDRRGIDLVIETIDVGDLYIQIKSSHIQRVKFQDKRGPRPIPVIVVEREDTSETLRNKVLAEALALRERFLAQHRKWDEPEDTT